MIQSYRINNNPTFVFHYHSAVIDHNVQNVLPCHLITLREALFYFKFLVLSICFI